MNQRVAVCTPRQPKHHPGASPCCLLVNIQQQNATSLRSQEVDFYFHFAGSWPGFHSWRSSCCCPAPTLCCRPSRSAHPRPAWQTTTTPGRAATGCGTLGGAALMASPRWCSCGWAARCPERTRWGPCLACFYQFLCCGRHSRKTALPRGGAGCAHASARPAKFRLRPALRTPFL